jgi:putative ABC transport system ATP-binding protein
MSSTAVLEATDVVKELGQGAGLVRALKGVSLSLNAGELTLLMGPSGSGKTTLLSILGCILGPTSGRIRVAGTDTANLGPEALADVRRRHIGFVFQSYNLFPTLNAVENVRLALDVRGRRGRLAADQAREALTKVGLSHKFKSYPSNMSGGEQQRVAVARALASAPSLLLADEPTAALDAENGQSVMALLSEIAKDKSHAVLAVTHDHRTLPYADRIIHIEDGLIVSDERPERVRAAIVSPPPTIPLDEVHSERALPEGTSAAAPTRLAKKRKTKFHG